MNRKRKLCEMNGSYLTEPLGATPPSGGQENEDAVDDPGEQNFEQSQEQKPTKKLRFSKDYLQLLVLRCEFNECNNEYKKMEDFLPHVAEHCMTLEEVDDGWTCQWQECGFVCHTKDELDRHIFFHAFHTKVKGLGAIMLNEKQMQCSLDPSGRNLVPEIPEPFLCCWNDCQLQFNSVQNFYWHVQSHAESVNRIDGNLQCGWQDCSKSCRLQVRLRDHTRSHTQEKVAGCPGCGSIYSNPTKLCDHCSQQIPPENLNFRCSHCSRKFSTERLLRDHLRHHINLYKCSECDMTTPSRSALQCHVLHRHSHARPHKCLQCGKTFKTVADVNRHMTTHSQEPAYECPYDDCHFGAKALSTLHLHVRKVHQGLSHPYLCHICDAKYELGHMLSKHLMQIHNFHCPSGHSRFRYKQDEDGYYRLQTVRYESVELIQDTSAMQRDEEQVDQQLTSDLIQETQAADEPNEVMLTPPDSGQPHQEILMPSDW